MFSFYCNWPLTLASSRIVMTSDFDNIPETQPLQSVYYCNCHCYCYYCLTSAVCAQSRSRWGWDWSWRSFERTRRENKRAWGGDHETGWSLNGYQPKRLKRSTFSHWILTQYYQFSIFWWNLFLSGGGYGANEAKFGKFISREKFACNWWFLEINSVKLEDEFDWCVPQKGR